MNKLTHKLSKLEEQGLIENVKSQQTGSVAWKYVRRKQATSVCALTRKSWTQRWGGGGCIHFWWWMISSQNYRKPKCVLCPNLRNGYWHCKLDKGSSYLNTFQTPRGSHIWLKSPFDLTVGSEIFQETTSTLDNHECVVLVADDILVYVTWDNQTGNRRPRHQVKMFARQTRRTRIAT